MFFDAPVRYSVPCIMLHGALNARNTGFPTKAEYNFVVLGVRVTPKAV